MPEDASNRSQSSRPGPAPGPVLALPVLDQVSERNLSLISDAHRELLPDLGSFLSTMLHSELRLHLLSVEQIAADTLPTAVRDIGWIIQIGFNEWSLRGAFLAGRQLVSTLLELALGGRGKDPLILQRPLTAAEKQILGRIFNLFLQTFEPVWAQFGCQTAEMLGLVEDQSGRNLTLFTGGVLLFTLEVESEAGTDSLSLVLPVEGIQNNFESAETQAAGSDAGGTSGRFTNRDVFPKLAGSPVEVEVNLLDLQIDLADLLALRQGQVVIFDRPCDAQVTMLVNGEPVSSGCLEQSEGRVHFHVRSRLVE